MTHVVTEACIRCGKFPTDFICSRRTLFVSVR